MRESGILSGGLIYSPRSPFDGQFLFLKPKHLLPVLFERVHGTLRVSVRKCANTFCFRSLRRWHALPGERGIRARSYPFREADLIVSCLTREQGKLRGVAKRARRPKSAFGAGLERLSHIRLSYYQRENAELASLSGCELITSVFSLQSDYERSIALDYFAEVSEQILPPHEANEKFFRLLIATLDYLRAGGATWTAVDYFTLWAVRLSGVLPELRVSAETAEVADEIFHTPLAKLDTPRMGQSTVQCAAPATHPFHRATR